MIIDHRYEVLEVIGSGTWSNVYKVVDKRKGGLYTLKLFQYMSSEDFYDRFTAEEMHHVIRIEHPNLAHIVDFGHVGDHIYTLTEFYDGTSLKNFRFRKSQIETLYDIIVQITYALDALHNQDIVHKDLKPENVLYRIEGNLVGVKVIDYGFTKVDSQKDQQNVAGSLPYMAPEVYLNTLSDFRSDYYSLGVLLYRITTGSFPFSVEQINALITGSQQYFIPRFPSELNEEVSPELEKFILRLLEKNPDSRFKSAEEIINYVNRIQSKKYPFSVEWSLVNKLKFNSYISRDRYCHQLLDYMQSVENSNGKVVSVIAGEGLGKDSVLSLFRYHLLNGKYFLFDYTCSRQDHEPFFALIKEFIQSITPEEMSKLDSLEHISEKFKLYLFESTTDAKKVSQNQAELQADFESVTALLGNLSAQKPIIFIIRNAQYVHKYTIDFINFIANFVSRHKIFITMGFNEISKIYQIEHTSIIQIPALTYRETSEYINKLLFEHPTEKFISQIWYYTAGNPYFIREILIDLVQKNHIVKDKRLQFEFDFNNYALPTKLVHSIYSRLGHITAQHYQYLQLLSIVEPPLTKELITHILKLADKDLYDFMNEAIYNEILTKLQYGFVFTYISAKEKLKSEIEPSVHKKVSKAVIAFFNKIPVHDIDICRGIITNAEIAGDIKARRTYNFRLYELYDESFNQDLAYQSILDVLMIDFSPELKLPQSTLLQDMMIFQQKTELTGLSKYSQEFLANLNSLPDFFEKYYILGTIFFISENFTKAIQYFDKATKFIVTGKQRVLVLLYYVQIYLVKDPPKALENLNILSGESMPLDLKILYTDKLVVYYKNKGENLYAIKVAEDFIGELPSVQDTSVLLRLASLHNNLGVCYSSQKTIEAADEHFDIALSIWKRFNIKRYLGLIYNNIADLYLKQGITTTAVTYLHKGYDIAQEQGLMSFTALALLNLGEAYIKMGEFQKAEDYLLHSRSLINKMKSSKYLNEINMNLALAKSKIKDFGYYYRFINEHEPDLKEGIINHINPLIKTYFYYLFELGLSKKLSKLFRRNAHIDYHEIHEDEFYYNTMSLIAILNQDYTQALDHLKNAEKFAGEVKNHYAITVFYLLEIECYIGIRDIPKAKDKLDKALELANNYQYHYWYVKLRYFKSVIDLTDPSMPLRKILRELLNTHQEAHNAEYFSLESKIDLQIIKILLVVNADAESKARFENYKQFLKKITRNIDEDDREIYLKQTGFYITDVKAIDTKNIVSRYQNIRANWYDLQYSLLSNQDAERMKFFIIKGLREIIAPWKFQIMLYSEKHSSYSIFLSDSQHDEYIFSTEIYQLIDQAFKTDNITTLDFDNAHNMIIPLQIKYHRIGFMIISDHNEVGFTKLEISLIKTIKQHITSLIIRIQDYSEITQRMAMMNRLMSITHALLKIIDIRVLESEITSACIDFTQATRGFLIKKDEEGNYIYQVAMDQNKSLITTVSMLSKTVLSACQSSRAPIYTYNAQEDNRFKSSISVQDYKLHTIFCAPLLVDDQIYGFIYLDNLLDNSRQMYLNSEVISLLFDQLSIALKNALQYGAIIQKSHELQSLESLKDEFMAIIGHELNTPLSSLQGYVSRLKRNLYADEEEKNDIITKIESSVKKLIITTNDIVTMNNYNLKTELSKVQIQISDILNMILHEVEIASRHRKMFIKVEAPQDLPLIEGNWEAIHLMVYNIVLNAIRFTNDFGTINIGARISAFQEEKINNRETLVIYVQDNGIGIPEYQLKNVFRKFYELNEIYAHKSGTIEYRSSGLGLGLATAKRIAELHNGNIWIKSKENEGTTVFINLPIKQEK